MGWFATPELVTAAITAMRSMRENGLRLTINPGHFNVKVDFLDHDGKAEAMFSLSELPGCCGVLVSHGTWLREDRRGRGLSGILMNRKVAIAKKFKYDCLQATVLESNTAEIKSLTARGWKKAMTFVNPKTTNAVGLWTLDVNSYITAEED